MLKRVLLSTAISLCACEHLPPVPEHTQYGIHANVNPPGFYGVKNTDNSRVFRPFTDPHMKAGQCLSSSDYQKMQDWVKQVEEIARGRCQ